MPNHLLLVQQCDYIYQNKFFKCTYIHLRSFHSTLGLLTHNATWCQNRGCICISSTRRTYGRIHAVSCIHPVIQTSTIILWTELFPKERREKIQGEILQRPHSSSNPRVFPVSLHAIQQLQVSTFNSTYRINSTTRNSKEIQELQGSSRADS